MSNFSEYVKWERGDRYNKRNTPNVDRDMSRTKTHAERCACGQVTRDMRDRKNKRIPVLLHLWRNVRFNPKKDKQHTH